MPSGTRFTRTRLGGALWWSLLAAAVVLKCKVDDRPLVPVIDTSATSVGGSGHGGTLSTAATNAAGTTQTGASGGTESSGGAGGSAGRAGAGGTNNRAGAGGSQTQGTGGAKLASSTSGGSGGEEGGPVSRQCLPVQATETLITDFSNGELLGGDPLEHTLTGGVFSYPTPAGELTGMTIDADAAAGTLTVSGLVETYSGFGFWFDVRPGDGISCADCCLDTRDCEGIAFDISGTAPEGIVPRLRNNSTLPIEGDPARGACEFSSVDTMWAECVFPEAPAVEVGEAPTTVEVPFASFSAGLPEVKQGAPSELVGLQWDFPWTEGNDYDVDVVVENVRFYGGSECGSAERVVPPGGCAPTIVTSSPCDEVVEAIGNAPLIDDFEDGDANFSDEDGRTGWEWYFAVGDDDLVTPAGGFASEVLSEARDGSQVAFHTAGQDTWAVLGAVFVPLSDDTMICYDATAYAGVSFWARGSGEITLRATTPRSRSGGAFICDCGDEVECDCCTNADFQRSFEVTDEWQLYTVNWDEFAQVDGSRAPFLTSELTEVSFVFASAWDLWVDDVSFLTE